MAELPTMIQDLALMLVVAGIVTLIFKRLKQPLVLGYIVAGFLVSPHMPYTASVADRDNIQLWADIGVMFLLFSLGLDFSFKKILKMGASPFISTMVIIFSMSMLGVCVGHSFGWSRMDCIFLGGMLAMSSTTIIYKAFDDLGLRQQQFASLVMSVLILEDILAIVMMVMLSAIASGNNPDGGQMLGSIVKIGFFLVLWLVVGIFAIPIFLRRVRRLINNEVLLIVSLGLCCAMAVFSTKVGFSSAFGAFIMGSILAETIEAEKIEKLVEPVKNLFGAIFFVSVGMLVDPQILVSYAFPIIALILTILLGQAIFGSFSFMLAGESLKSAAYSALEHRLPTRLISALNQLSMSHPNSQQQSAWKRLLKQMAVNTLVYSILSSASIAVMFTFVLPFMQKLLPGWTLHWYANAITGFLTVMLVAPFLRAMVMKKNHSEEWKKLWAESNRNRLPLLFTVLVRILVALSFIFYICHYLSQFNNAVIITLGIIIIALIIVSRWVKRRSIVLERLFVNNLRSRDIEAQVQGKKRPLYEGKLLDRDIHIAEFDVPTNSLWMGSTLKELNLGKKYGVHISSILRGGFRMNIPDGDYTIFPCDRLQVIGSDEQMAKFSHALETEVIQEDIKVENREMKLRQLIISADSPFVGKTLEESGIRSLYRSMVVGIEEGKENLSPVRPNRRFAEGDIIWVVGEEESLNELNTTEQR